ncbi:MAG: DinB family protein [Caldilineaceae bacterium]|nr:DinB family protein [Caldilineaceae bacterium]
MNSEPEPTLIEFVLYNQWANQQLLSICMKLDEELLAAKIPGTYGSILDTFRHLLRAEASFLQRVHGTAPRPAFNWDEVPSLAQLAVFADQVAETFLETVQNVVPTQNVHEENDEWTFDYQARLIFMSLAYHGIAHRTDMTTFLTSKGLEMPELDIWAYQEAYPDRFQAKLAKKKASSD